MSVCVSCGKKGFFLRVNESGMCADCSFAKEEAVRAESVAFFEQLKNMYSELLSELKLPENPCDTSEICSEINKKIELCDDFNKLLPSCLTHKYFRDCLIESTGCSSGYCKIVSFDVYLWVERPSLVNDFIDTMSERIVQHRHIWFDHKFNIMKIASFHNCLRNLSRVPVLVSKCESSVNSVCVPDFVFSSVTRRTNFSSVSDFVVLDVETTGLKSSCDKIIEVSAVKFHNWQPVDIFTSLVNPGCDIPSNIVELTGISNDSVSEAPSFFEIADSLSGYIGSYNIVGHNLGFDLDFLFWSGLKLESSKRKYFDTLQLAKSTYKDVDGGYSLNSLCDHLHIRDNDSAHRASSDALASGFVFREICNRIKL